MHGAAVATFVMENQLPRPLIANVRRPCVTETEPQAACVQRPNFWRTDSSARTFPDAASKLADFPPPENCCVLDSRFNTIAVIANGSRVDVSLHAIIQGTLRKTTAVHRRMLLGANSNLPARHYVIAIPLFRFRSRIPLTSRYRRRPLNE